MLVNSTVKGVKGCSPRYVIALVKVKWLTRVVPPLGALLMVNCHVMLSEVVRSEIEAAVSNCTALIGNETGKLKVTLAP